MRSTSEIVSIILGIFFMFLLLMANIYLDGVNKNLKMEAVNRGYAEHNKTNGEWQWKENFKQNRVIKLIVPDGYHVEIVDSNTFSILK